MIKKFIIITLILLSLNIASATITLTQKDFDGIDDQVQINNALTKDDVYLQNCLVVIGDTIKITQDNRKLYGTSDSCIKLEANSDFVREQSMILVDHADNVEIYGFMMDGNKNNNQHQRSGNMYHNLINALYCNNINVHNMYLTNNHGDAFKPSFCNGVNYNYNTIFKIGHDGLYAVKSNAIVAEYNTITLRINSGLRLYNSNNVIFKNNDIKGTGEGGAGVEIQKYGSDYKMDNIEVCNNKFNTIQLPAIWLFGSNSYPKNDAYVNIHDNIINDAGRRITGGISIDGFNADITNNKISNCQEAALITKSFYSPRPTATGFIINDNGNTYSNCGNIIVNSLSAQHSIVENSKPNSNSNTIIDNIIDAITDDDSDDDSDDDTIIVPDNSDDDTIIVPDNSDDDSNDNSNDNSDTNSNTNNEIDSNSNSNNVKNIRDLKNVQDYQQNKEIKSENKLTVQNNTVFKDSKINRNFNNMTLNVTTMFEKINMPRFNTTILRFRLFR